MAPSKKRQSGRVRGRKQGAPAGRQKDAEGPRVDARPEAAAGPPSEEELQGPPPREATIIRSDRERQHEARLEEPTASSPRLSGGDVDADWKRADSVGEEAVGGSVATPDQDVVDDLGDAFGVPRAPDEEIRTSREILEGRDRSRWEQEG
jgi:hypothetical protein